MIYASYLGLEEGKKVPMHLLYNYLSMMLINGISKEYEYWTFEQQVAQMKALSN